MYGPTERMSRAARRSHTSRMSRRSRTQCVTLNACHALHTFSVLNACQIGYALMSRTNNAWQAMQPGNARMSRTARMLHSTRISHSY